MLTLHSLKENADRKSLYECISFGHVSKKMSPFYCPFNHIGLTLTVIELVVDLHIY